MVGFTEPAVADVATVSEATAAQAGLSYRSSGGPKTVKADAEEHDPTYGYSRTETKEGESGDIAEAEAQEAEDSIQSEADDIGYDPTDLIHAAGAYNSFVHKARAEGIMVPSMEELDGEQADQIVAAYMAWDGKNTQFLWNQFEDIGNASQSEENSGQANADAAGESRQDSGEQATTEGNAESVAYTAPAAGKAAQVVKIGRAHV